MLRNSAQQICLSVTSQDHARLVVPLIASLFDLERSLQGSHLLTNEV